MPIRSPLSGPSSPLSCSSATCASARTRCVCVGERLTMRLTRHRYHMPAGVLFFRVSRLRWLVSSVRLRPGGLDACCRFPPRPYRPSSLTESQSVSSHAQVSKPPCFCTCEKLSSSLVHRRQSTTGSTAPCLWKVPLNPGKKILECVGQIKIKLTFD